ncbi:hypothetical protein MTR_4g045720 [Medicago truncatula]|uniref:Uncharacterized protein n=1 Tax=Medicago truncatula TaxID=3880 RepID=A0A072UJF6_MEDTR|nr:hypothetical protein MTR_4g045720 [Medicago truncatula]
MIILIDRKPERAIYAKIKDQRQSNCIRSGTIHLGHPAIKDLRFEASTDQRLGTGAFKIVRENNGEAYLNILLEERLHSGIETWLSTMERTSTLSKMLSESKKNKKKSKLAKLKT